MHRLVVVVVMVVVVGGLLTVVVGERVGPSPSAERMTPLASSLLAALGEQ